MKVAYKGSKFKLERGKLSGSHWCKVTANGKKAVIYVTDSGFRVHEMGVSTDNFGDALDMACDYILEGKRDPAYKFNLEAMNEYFD